MTSLDRETMTFIRNRIRERFEETCKTPKQCAAGMIPNSCEACQWEFESENNEAHKALRQLRHNHPVCTEKEMVENHYYRSHVDECVVCGGDVWMRVKTKPAHWESDVKVTTFYLKCRVCGHEWSEFDSD